MWLKCCKSSWCCIWKMWLQCCMSSWCCLWRCSYSTVWAHGAASLPGKMCQGLTWVLYWNLHLYFAQHNQVVHCHHCFNHHGSPVNDNFTVMGSLLDVGHQNNYHLSNLTSKSDAPHQSSIWNTIASLCSTCNFFFQIHYHAPKGT